MDLNATSLKPSLNNEAAATADAIRTPDLTTSFNVATAASFNGRSAEDRGRRRRLQVCRRSAALIHKNSAIWAAPVRRLDRAVSSELARESTHYFPRREHARAWARQPIGRIDPASGQRFPGGGLRRFEEARVKPQQCLEFPLPRETLQHQFAAGSSHGLRPFRVVE
jgi:hypothetical protein